MYIRLDDDMVFSNWIRAGSVVGVKMARLDEALARGRNHSVWRTFIIILTVIAHRVRYTAPNMKDGM